MANNFYSLEALAIQIARHQKGDKSASDYLRQQGVDLSIERKITLESPSPLIEPKASFSPTKEELSDKDIEADFYAKIAARKEPFTFSLFTVESKKQLNLSQKYFEIEGRIFQFDDDLDNASVPEKQPLEQLPSLITRLKKALRLEKPGHNIAIKPLVKCVAKQEVIECV